MGLVVSRMAVNLRRNDGAEVVEGGFVGSLFDKDTGGECLVYHDETLYFCEYMCGHGVIMLL